MNKLNIITSWDDGHPLDLKLADLLKKYNIPGIFYLPIKNDDGIPILASSQITQLAKHFEIGGHAYHHIDLVTVNLELAEQEIITGKIELENILGKKITSFCFPKGHYNQDIISLVKKAGFKHARSARLFNANQSSNSSFIIHPNLQFYPHNYWIDILHCIKLKDLDSLMQRLCNTHQTHLKCAIPLLKKNQTLHIWGHSWEIEKYNLWNELEILFKAISILNRTE